MDFDSQRADFDTLRVKPDILSSDFVFRGTGSDSRQAGYISRIEDFNTPGTVSGSRSIESFFSVQIIAVISLAAGTSTLGSGKAFP
jgi:hypothetical protein